VWPCNVIAAFLTVCCRSEMWKNGRIRPEKPDSVRRTSASAATGSGEGFGVQFRKEGFVQALDYLGDFVFFDHEGEVDF
jgi:hypothetical protein